MPGETDRTAAVRANVLPEYIDGIDPVARSTVEEELAATIRVHAKDDIGAEMCARLGRDLLKLALAYFRPDLFERPPDVITGAAIEVRVDAASSDVRVRSIPPGVVLYVRAYDLANDLVGLGSFPGDGKDPEISLDEEGRPYVLYGYETSNEGDSLL